MDLFSMLIVYILVWWVTLFAVLPHGVKGQAESNDIVKGTEPGAPVESRIKKKFIQTTIAATVLWVIICGIIMSGVIDLRALSGFEHIS